MTVCIAMICDSSQCIVAVSDTMLSASDFSADSLALKVAILSEQWGAMWATNDVTQIVPVIASAKSALDGRPNTLSEVSTAIVSAYQKHTEKLATDRFLSTFGLNMQTFLAEGRRIFTREVFNDLCTKIQGVELGHDLLIFGFDQAQTPHIFTVSDPSCASFHDPLGFWAVGSGGYSAQSVLYFHACNFNTPRNLAIYHACEAKFMSESASGVGKATFALIMDKTGDCEILWPDHIAIIRTLWDLKGRPRIPESAEQTVTQILSDAKGRGDQWQARRRSATAGH